MLNANSLWYFWKTTGSSIISLLIYSLLLPSSILLRLISLYNYCLSCIKYLLLSAYFLIMRFSVAPESIIVFFVFPLILILMYSWAVLVEATYPLFGAIPQHFFWLLLLEKFNSFPFSFSENIFSDYTEDYSGEILHSIYTYSGLRMCPLYRIIMMFVYNS